MGLAISYSFNLTDASISEAREKVIALHQCASELSLIQIGELIELEGEACLFQQPDPHIVLKTCALRPEEIVQNLLNNTAETKCCYLIGFNILPGQGSSGAAFGLATHLGESKNWLWHASCKTQYASNPEYGGTENFVKCHLSVLRMVEYAQELGILKEVVDPSGYWEQRNLEALVETVAEQNVLTAAIMGSIKDAFSTQGYRTIAPILDWANFEYLEARGNDLKMRGDK